MSRRVVVVDQAQARPGCKGFSRTTGWSLSVADPKLTPQVVDTIELATLTIGYGSTTSKKRSPREGDSSWWDQPLALFFFLDRFASRSFFF